MTDKQHFTKTTSTANETIVEVFERVAVQFPERIAIRNQNLKVQLSYRELNQHANALAAALQKRGVVAGDVVAMAFPHSAEWSVCMLAVLKCGAAYLPLDTSNPVLRLQACLRTANARCVLTGQADEASAYAEDLPVLSYVLSALEPVGSLEGEKLDKLDENVRAEQALTSDSLAYVMFTSGSTGKPKAVLVPHRAVVRLVVNTNYIAIKASDSVLQFAPPSFDASTFEFWAPLLNGACLVPYSAKGLDPNRLKQDIAQNNVSVMWLTAALFHLVVERFIEAILPLRVLLAGGDVLNAKFVRKALETIPGLTLINGYGPTENTTFTCCHVMTADNPPQDNVPIGTAITGTTLHILNDELQPVAPGEAGQLYVSGKGVALGYLATELNEAAQQAFFSNINIANGTIYNTGDLVKALPDGAIEFIGRQDNQVKIRGYRVSLEEIKSHLADIPGVSDVLVLVERYEGGDQLLFAYIKSGDSGGVGETERADETDHNENTAVNLTDNHSANHDVSQRASLNPKIIKQHLAGTLPDYMIPDRFVFCDELPINENGKLDKKLLG